MFRQLLNKGSRIPSVTALLLFAFLFAQGVVLTHDLDADTYHSDHVCSICSVASVFGGANIALAADFAVIPADRSIEPGTAVAVLSRSVWRARARAPPITS